MKNTSNKSNYYNFNYTFLCEKVVLHTGPMSGEVQGVVYLGSESERGPRAKGGMPEIS